jgi:hypothetical protein
MIYANSILIYEETERKSHDSEEECHMNPDFNYYIWRLNVPKYTRKF